MSATWRAARDLTVRKNLAMHYVADMAAVTMSKIIEQVFRSLSINLIMMILVLIRLK